VYDKSYNRSQTLSMTYIESVCRYLFTHDTVSPAHRRCIICARACVAVKPFTKITPHAVFILFLSSSFRTEIINENKCRIVGSKSLVYVQMRAVERRLPYVIRARSVIFHNTILRIFMYIHNIIYMYKHIMYITLYYGVQEKREKKNSNKNMTVYLLIEKT
jgi:hypothetical protein